MTTDAHRHTPDCPLDCEDAERALCAIVAIWVEQPHNVMIGRIRRRWPSLGRALDSAAETLQAYKPEPLPSNGFWLSSSCRRGHPE